MAICNFEAPNGRSSLLFAGLSQLMGDEKAAQAWYMLRSQRLLNKSGDWTNPDAEVRVAQDENGEPTLDSALQLLGLGNTAQLAQHMKLVSRWKLTPIAGTLNEYYATRTLAHKMHLQLQKSGDLYRGITILYNATSNRFEIRPKTELYRSEAPINVYSTDHNGFQMLSNLAPSEVTYGGVKYATVEAAFQAQKAIFAGDTQAAKSIAATVKGTDAKAWGKKVKGLDPAAWDKVSAEIMEKVMRASFEQNPARLELLLKTGNARITHNSNLPGGRTDKWTTLFPELLMKLRTELRPSQGVQSVEAFIKSIEEGKYPDNVFGVPVQYVDSIQTQKGTPVAMRNDNGTILVNLEEMKKKFEDKAWTKPALQLDGTKATALPENAFSTVGQWVAFGLLHEYAHTYIKRAEGETTGSYEDRINNEALSKMGIERSVVIGAPGVTIVSGRTYEGAITELGENQVFVFGANDSGLHGKGAAGVAMGKQRDKKEVITLSKAPLKDRIGKWAVIGEHSKISIGKEGKSYGLVTVRGELGNKDVNTRATEQEMLEEISKFYKTAEENPQLEFLVAYSGAAPKSKNLSGYTSMEMANLFGALPIPENVIFEKNFRTLMENSPVKFINDLVLQDQSTRLPLQVNEKVLEAARKSLQIEVLDEQGKGTGRYFSAEQQVQATNSIIYNIALIVNRKKRVKDEELKEEILTLFRTLWKAFSAKEAGEDIMPQFTEEQAAAMKLNLTDVINSFDTLFRDSLKRLKVYGIDFKKSLDDTGTEYSDVDVQEGKGLENFNDLVFSLDPRDTASARLKVFMATVEESREGIIPRPKTVRMPMAPENMQQVLAGIRTVTVRTAQQLKDMRMDMAVGRNKGAVKFGDKWFVAQVVSQMSAAEAQSYNNSENAEAGHTAAEGDYLVTLSEYKEEKGIVPVHSFIGVPEIAEFESLFEDVTGLLADREPSFAGYIEALKASGKPNLMRLADKLTYSGTPEQIRKEFVTVMTKAYTQYALVQYSGNPEKGMQIQTFNANMYSARRVIVKTWQEMQKLSPLMQRDVAGNFVMDANIVQELKGAYTELQARMKQENQTVAQLIELEEKAKSLVERMFTVNGMKFTDKMYADLFKNLENYTKGTTLSSATVLEAWKVTKTDEPKGIFSAFLSRIIREKAEEDELESSLEKNNPLYREPSTMRILSRWYARHSESLYNSSHRDFSGNNIWDYTLNTYLSKTFNDLTAKDSSYREQLKQTFFARNNWLMQYWDSHENVRDRSEILFLEGLKKRYGKKGSEREEMSDRDQLFMALGMYMNQGRRFADFLGMTHSDKTRTPVFTNMPRTQVMSRGNDVHQELLNRLYTVFESEFDRIVLSSQHTYEQSQYEAGKKFFFMMPVFNYASMVKLRDGGLITEEELAMLWVSDGVPNAPAKGTTAARQVVNKILTIFVKNEAQRQLEEFTETGIVDMVKGTHLFDIKYVRSKHVETQARILQRGDNYFDMSSGAQVPISKEEYLKKLAFFVATDYAMNSFLFNTSMVQLLYGDPAQVFKKDVESTLIEYQKRMAGHIAPGKETEWEQPNYHAVTLADMEVGLSYIENIKQYHKDVNVTDAQEFVTMEEHLTVMRQYGQIAEDTYKEMMAIIKPGEDYEFTDPEHLKIVLQITKPVYYGKRALENGAILHDYVKSSALVLYPPFTRGLAIDGLRRDMERGVQVNGQTVKLARAHFKSAKKIGYPKASPSFPASGQYSGVTPYSVQVLSRDGFRIQQEVPYDPQKDEIQIASQSNKLFTADMPATVKVTLKSGKTLEGPSEIRRYKEELRIRMLAENKTAFMQEMDVEETSDGYRFRDPKKFVKKLVEVGKGKNYSENELMPLATLINGEPIAPMFFTSLADPIQNMMMSMVDDLIKVKLQGKSYVQASSVGLTKLQEGTQGVTGITWLPGSDPSRQLHMPKKNSDGTVSPAEILVPFHFFNGDRKMSLKDVLNEDGTLNLEKLPMELLDMIGIRIPTSKQNSMLPMRIVGFLPENMGDTIIVPPGITTQMGSDFDVDKLFVYRRPYTAGEESILTPDTDDKAEYFDLMWHTLLSPDMYDILMSPLDKPDLKDEAARLGTIRNAGNFFTGRRQRADFLSQKDAKRLVGFGALTNTFLAGIQDLNLFVGEPQFSDDGKLLGFEPEPIKTFGGLQVYKLSGYGTSTYEGEVRTKLDNIGIMLSEFLDHAKNRTIDKLNLTVHTYSAAAALMSMEDEQGRALDLRYVSRMLTQEVIKEFNLRMQRGNDMLSGYTPNLKETIIAELKDKLIRAGAKLTEKSYTAQELESLVKNPSTTQEYYSAQLDILTAFEKLDKIGTRMSEMSALLNQDVNGTGGNLFNVMDKRAKATDVLANNVIINGETLMQEDGGQTEKGYIFDMVNGIAGTLFNDYMPHAQVFTSVISYIQKITGRTSATQVPLQVRKDVLKALRSFVYTNTVSELGVTNVSGERARLLYTTPQGPSLAERVATAKQSWGDKNYLLRRLQPVIGNGQSPSYVTFIASKVTRIDDQENVRAWMELLTSTDAEKRMLGEDLIRYVYLTGGNQDASNFVRYVPFGYLMSTGWFESLKRDYNRITGEDSSLLRNNFLEQWFRHNPEQAMELRPADFGIKGIPEMITIPWDDPSKTVHPSRKFLVILGQEQEYTPYVSVRTEEGSTLLYRKVGSDTSGVNYMRMDTLGSSLTDEYDLTSPAPRSILQENRALNDKWMDVQPVSEVKPTIPPQIKPVQVKEELEIPKIIKDTLMIDKVNTSVQELQQTVIPAILAKGNIPVYMEKLYEYFKGIDEAKHGDLYENSPLGLSVRIGTSADPRVTRAIPAQNQDLGTAVYSRGTNEIIMGTRNAGIGNITPFDLHHVFLHELLHWTVSPIIEYKITGGKVEPRIARAVNNLQDLYEYVKKNAPALAYHYQMSDIHEFIVGGTTNREFMQALNRIKYEKQSLLASLWNALSDLIAAISDYIGMPLNKDSVLMEFYRNTAVLMAGSEVELQVLNIDTVQFNKQPVRVGVDVKGNGVAVGPEFMRDSPEPLRQQNISAILSQYGKDKDIDAGTGEPFRGAKVQTELEPQAPATDGRYELFPGVFANEQQRKAIDLIPMHIENAKGSFAERSFVLSGAGGTGKTTIIRKIAEQFPNKEIAFAAPSHNAVVELKAALRGPDGKRKWSVNTIQSELRMRLDTKASYEQGRDVFVRGIAGDNGESMEPKPVEIADIIIIDESSMVDTQMVQWLEEAARQDAVIIWLGDYAQLPPVGESGTSWPFREVMPHRGVRLIENMRTSKADVAAVLTQYRQGIDQAGGQEQNYRLPVIPYTDRIQSENVSLYTSKPEMIKKYVEAFRQDPNNPKNALIISYRNATRQQYNEEIRKLLFGEAAAQRYTKGDLIIFNTGLPALSDEQKIILSSAFGTKGSTFVAQRAIVERYTKTDNIQAKVPGTRSVPGVLNIPGERMDINLGPEGDNKIVTVEGFDKQIVANILATMRGKYDKARKGFEVPAEFQKMLGGTFISYGDWLQISSVLKGQSFDVDYAYAVTSHKSQGSTYNHTFVDEYDIATVSMASRRDLVHSLYTAVSRTREHLYIFHPAQKFTTQPSNKILNSAAAMIANGSNGPWAYRSETEAQNAVDKIKNILPGIDARRDGTQVMFMSAALQNSAPGKKVTAQVQRIIDKLTDQRMKVRKSMTSITDPKVRAEKRLQIQKIEEDIETLKNKGNMEQIAQIGARQLQWVSKTIERADPSVTDIMTAYHVTDVWSNIVDILFGDNEVSSLPEISDEMSALMTKARTMRSTLVNGKMRGAMIEMTDNRLSAKDFTKGLEDMGNFTAYAMSLNRAASQLVQEIDLFLKTAGRRAESEMKELFHELEALGKKMDAAGGRDTISKMMVQENPKGDAFGLVQQFSQEWYDQRAKLRNIRSNSILKIKNAGLAPDLQRKNLERIWRNYWRDIHAIGVFADITELFDDKGELLADISKEKKRIFDALGGDTGLTEKMIRHAQERYKKYLEDLQEYSEAVDAKYNEGTITLEQAMKEKIQFQEKNSPVRFFNQAKTTADFTGLNEGDKYAVLYPKASKGEFYDEKYSAIMVSPQLTEIYHEYYNLMKRFKSYLPLYVQWDMHENFLPAVEQHLLGQMTAKEYLGSMNQRIRDSLTATKYEEARKDRDDIPIRFVHKDRENAQNYSRDLIRIAEMFGMMAIHYRHFSQVKDAVDMGEVIVKEAHRQRVAGLDDGQVLTNTLNALSYAKSYMMFKNARQLEGKTNTVLYSMNPLVQRRMAAKVKELMIRKNALEKELLDPPAGKTISDIRKEMEEVDVELTKIEGQNVYLSKVGDRLIGINQLKALAFNPFSGFANLAFGVASLAIYANGKADFNMSQAMTAMQMMTSSTRKYFTFGKSASPMAGKILALMEKTGILGDIVDSQYGESNLASYQNKLKKSIDPYTFLRSSDYYMKGSTLVATMLGTKVQVDGKEINLWEAYDDAGNLKYPELEGWDHTDLEKAPNWEKFRNRALRISQIVMGNMDRNSPKLMNKYIIGRLIGQFRASWLPEGWAARWEDEKFDVQLNRTIKGRYKTYADVGLSGSITILTRQFMGMLGGSKNYFEGIHRDLDGKLVSESEIDMENMRRNFTGMMWTLSLMAATLMLKSLIPDDDEDEGAVREALMIVLNLSNRVNQDLQFYSSPDVANSLIRNTVPAFDVVNDYIKAVKATQKAIMSEDYTWDQAALKWTKATPYLNQVNRMLYMTTHDVSQMSR